MIARSRRSLARPFGGLRARRTSRNYEENQATFNKMLGFDDDTSEPLRRMWPSRQAMRILTDDANTDDWAKVRKRYFDLITYLTRDGIAR